MPTVNAPVPVGNRVDAMDIHSPDFRFSSSLLPHNLCAGCFSDFCRNQPSRAPVVVHESENPGLNPMPHLARIIARPPLGFPPFNLSHWQPLHQYFGTAADLSKAEFTCHTEKEDHRSTARATLQPKTPSQWGFRIDGHIPQVPDTPRSLLGRVPWWSGFGPQTVYLSPSPVVS